MEVRSCDLGGRFADKPTILRVCSGVKGAREGSPGFAPSGCDIGFEGWPVSIFDAENSFTSAVALESSV